MRVGLVDGQFIINPTYTEMRESLLNIMVVGTADGIVMIESGAKEVKEETVVDAIEFGHTEIKKICAAINELRDKVGKPKRKVDASGVRPGVLRRPEEAHWRASSTDALDTQKHPKAESYTLVKDIKKKLEADLPEDDEDAKKKLKHYYETLRERIFREQVINQKRRPDGARLRPDPRHLDRSRRPAPHPRVAPSSPAAKPKPWSRPPWAPATTCSAWKASKAKPRNASCCTITFPPFSVGEVAVSARSRPARNRARRAGGAGHFGRASDGREVALCDARSVGHSGVERFIVDGDRLRSVACR